MLFSSPICTSAFSRMRAISCFQRTANLIHLLLDFILEAILLRAGHQRRTVSVCRLSSWMSLSRSCSSVLSRTSESLVMISPSDTTVMEPAAPDQTGFQLNGAAGLLAHVGFQHFLDRAWPRSSACRSARSSRCLMHCESTHSGFRAASRSRPRLPFSASILPLASSSAWAICAAASFSRRCRLRVRWLFVDIVDDVLREVEDALQVARRYVQ